MTVLGDIPANADVATGISTKGLLSARPGPGVMGRFYEATDNNTLYRDSGATWETVATKPGSGTVGSRPAPGVAGRFYAPSDQTGVIYRDNGVSWDALLVPIASDTLAKRPTPGVNGRLYEATDVSVVFRDNGSEWIALPTTLASGTLAARPAAKVAGRLYEATDVKVIYRDTGAAWSALPIPLTPDTLAKRPGAAVLGRIFEATDVKVLYYDDGSTWQALPYGQAGLLSGRPAPAVEGRMYRATDAGLYRDTGGAWDQVMRSTDMMGIFDLQKVVNLGETAITNAVNFAPLSPASDKVTLTAPRALTGVIVLLAFRASIKKLGGEVAAYAEVAPTINTTGIPSPERKGSNGAVIFSGPLCQGQPPICDANCWSTDASAVGTTSLLSGAGDYENDAGTVTPGGFGGGILPIQLANLAAGEQLTVELVYRKGGSGSFVAHQRSLTAALIGK